ncbi:hypothetical protein KKB99_05570, partial [bacterium]|nr:hypothetical protein [bacterium]MBU1025465.1 hypothetical protein [bacterium]
MNRVLFVIFVISITVSLAACSSGKNNPVFPKSQDSMEDTWKPPELSKSADFKIPFELDILNRTVSLNDSAIHPEILNLDYDISSGWASFDLRMINSGKSVFDLYVNIEKITAHGELKVDGTMINRLKYGILVKGIKSSGRHIDLSFQPGTVPVLKGSIEGKTNPLFKNERTILHTDRFADHEHDYSSFSGRIIADQVLIRFIENITLEEQYRILDNFRLIPVGVNLSNGFIQADILDKRHPDDVVDDLMREHSIDHAEVNAISFVDFYPDDPIFDPTNPAYGENGLNSWGQRRIQAPEAYDFFNDRALDENGDIDTAYDTNSPVIMFICDTGYKYHEDYAIDAEDE